MHYSLFEVEDFCRDTFFIRWVLTPTAESNQFWKSFLAEYPQKEESIRLAADCVKALHFQETEPTPEALAHLKERIWTDVKDTTRTRRWAIRPVYYWAASVLFVLLIGVSWRLLRSTNSTYETADQIREIRLQDGSVVTLNAHSSLTVADRINEQKSRQVWIKGEAYFAIAKRKDKPFVVHTPETSIEVLGTEFNVNTRRQRTQVLLNQGKVQLRTRTESALVMQPGDIAIVTTDHQTVIHKVVQPAHYDAWKDHFIVMDDRRVGDIVELFKDTYGIQLHFQNPSLLNKKLSGKLMIKSPEEFVENLGTVLELSVEKKNEDYVFRSY
ncbi:hypothetical protein GCM10027347_62110 [Larkinella harenae]